MCRYNFLIKACFVSYDRFSDGFTFYQRMVDSGVQPTIVTFNELIKCCSRARSLSMATYYLKEMEKYGLQPDKITAHFVIVTCAKVGDFDSADTQLRNMQEHGIAPTQEMYAYLASGACTHNRPLRACAYLEECLARGLDVTSRLGESVLNSCIDSAEDKGALQAFQILNERCRVSTIGKASDEDKIHLDQGTHVAVLNLAARSGNVALAEVAWESLLACGYERTVVHYDSLWQAYAVGDDIASALATISEAMDDPQIGAKLAPTTFEALTEHLVLGGHEVAQEALELLQNRSATAAAATTSTDDGDAQSEPFVCRASIDIVNSVLLAFAQLGDAHTVFHSCFQVSGVHSCQASIVARPLHPPAPRQPVVCKGRVLTLSCVACRIGNTSRTNCRTPRPSRCCCRRARALGSCHSTSIQRKCWQRWSPTGLTSSTTTEHTRLWPRHRLDHID